MEPDQMTHEVVLHFNREYSGTLTLQMAIQVNWTEGLTEEESIDEMLSEAFPGTDFISHIPLNQE